MMTIPPIDNLLFAIAFCLGVLATLFEWSLHLHLGTIAIPTAIIWATYCKLTFWR